MLSKEHGIAEYDFGARLIIPDRLTRHAHAHYLKYARQVIHLYANGRGKTRRELHTAVQEIFSDEPDCPVRRIAAFCKLLDENANYDTDRRGAAAALRRKVFGIAGKFHPLVEQPDNLFESSEMLVKQKISDALGMPWEQIDQRLFGDVIEFQRLREFQEPESPALLLARYNVAQLQVVLYDAIDMTIRVKNDLKLIVRQAKLTQLMHRIRPYGDGYEIHLDGPASVLRQTRRYGIAMAKFLPSLLSCRDWKMRARVQARGGNWIVDLHLTSTDGFRGQVESRDFDSSVEEQFAKNWGPEPREGWTLHREATILHRGQKTFIPDFSLRHLDGREVLFEIVGFWTPEYLTAKAATLETFTEHDILLAVADVNVARFPMFQRAPIGYKKSLSVASVLRALNETTGNKL
ncbi:MAG: DUF790 family protein [Planctomycetota bacterium]|nr:DUF790 family protein [Planctomycetota bacterium]MDA1178852.1 DUF790 family protein [Planctomycetota bacterium]